MPERQQYSYILIKEKRRNHIVDHNVLIQGRAQYVLLEDGVSRWGVLNIYAPNQSANRKVFLQQLKSLLPQTIDKLIVGGDFNMMEEPDNRRGGRLTSIHG